MQRPIGRGQWAWGHGHQGDVRGHSFVVDAHRADVEDIRLLSAAAGLLSVDKSLCATDKCLMSTDESLEWVAASPLSADQGANFTASPSPPTIPTPIRTGAVVDPVDIDAHDATPLCDARVSCAQLRTARPATAGNDRPRVPSTG